MEGARKRAKGVDISHEPGGFLFERKGSAKGASSARELGTDYSVPSEKDQARKSTGRMPRHQTPKKDVASCEKLRGAASRH